MATLSNPTLKLELVSGTSNVKVTATVKVAFNTPEENAIKLLGVKWRLRCRIRGEDSGFNGADDALFSIASKTITADNTYTFVRTVSRGSLDEDWEGNDEIYARFNCEPTTPGFGAPAGPKDSPTITGNF